MRTGPERIATAITLAPASARKKRRQLMPSFLSTLTETIAHDNAALSPSMEF
jgi:hypothetical protein